MARARMSIADFAKPKQSKLFPSRRKAPGNVAAYNYNMCGNAPLNNGAEPGVGGQRANSGQCSEGD
jgi:hypothetical protein